MANMEVQRQPDTPFDLTILYMEDARSWCEYLFDIFQPYEVYQNSEEITSFPEHETTLNNIKASRAVIVIVSPVFLDNIDPRLQDYTHQVVALLCGVNREDLEQLEDSIPNYKDWKIVEALSGQRIITQVTLKLLDGMDSDTEDATDYLTMAGAGMEPEETYLTMSGGRTMEPEETYLTMEGNVGQKQFESEDLYLPMKGGSIEETEDEYTTMHGEQPGEDVYEQMTTAPPADTYEIIPSGKGPQMPPRVEPRKPPVMRAHEFAPKGGVAYINEPASSQMQYSEDIYITPSTVRSGTSEPLFIIFAKLQISNRPEDLYKALFKTSSGTFNVVAIYVNSHTLRVNELPKAITGGSVTVNILHNDNQIAALELYVKGAMEEMSELLSTITNPFDFMCEALNISPADTHMLDKVLHEHCKRHLPQEGAADFGRLLLTKQETKHDAQSSSEVPTVLHFAARYGLTQICMMLLDFPGAYQAMMMKNCDGDTPSGLAEKSGYEDLKQYLENHLEMGGSEGTQHPDEIGMPGHFTPSYVHMAGDLKNKNPQYTNRSGIGTKSDYDRPFPVAIPASSSPFMRDDTIKSLVSSGNENDIYDYYDNNQPSSQWSFQRENDDEDNGEDYEHIDEQMEEPPSRLPPKPSGPKDDDTTVMANVKITPMEELNRTPRSTHGADIPKDQQALIDLQNMVRENKISVDEAVDQFKGLQCQNQLSVRQSATMRDTSLKTPKKTGFNFLGRKKDVFNSFSEILRDKRGQSTFYTGPQEANGIAARNGDEEKTAVNSLISTPVAPTGGTLSATNKGALSPTLSPKQGRASDRFNQPEEMRNRPASTLSTGSRNSTLSTGSRDSSYGSVAEIDESESDAPVAPPSVAQRRMGDRGDRKSTRTTKKRFSARFENDYIDKPLPPLPIPSRGTTNKAPAAVAPSTGRQELLDDVPSYAPPPPPSQSSARRTSDPSSPPQKPQKPKLQPRRRVAQPDER